MAIKLDENKAKIIEFLKNHGAGVLATATPDGVPSAATVYFVTDDELNFYFVTKEKTTKHKNLQVNSHVSIAISDAKSQTTLQIDGKATAIEDIKQFMELFNRILDLNDRTSDSTRPPVSKLYAGDYFMYLVKPSKVRLAEYMKPDHGDLSSVFETVKP